MFLADAGKLRGLEMLNNLLKDAGREIEGGDCTRCWRRHRLPQSIYLHCDGKIMQHNEVEKLIKEYGAYSVNQRDDGVWIVKGDLELQGKNLTKLPFTDVGAYEVTGDFDCMENKLTSLEGAPQHVGGNFRCGDGKFHCEFNHLTSLAHCPQQVGGDF